MAKPDGKPAGKRASSGDAKQDGPPKRLKTAGGSARPAQQQHAGKPGGKPAFKPKEHVPAERLNRKEKKELDRERKARRNKNFTLIQEVVGLWEEARRHDASAQKRSKLVTAILAKVQGRVADLAGSHAASRVIQTCAKHGSPAERVMILKELEPRMLELCKSPYGHFVVSKLIALASKDQLPGLLKAFRGKLGELLRHPAGNHVVDDLYSVADAKQRNLMAAEFYGKEYVLFASGTLNNTEGPPAHLGELFSRVDGAKQRSIIQHMSKDLIPIMEKGLVDCPLVHRLVAEFMEHSPASVVADAAENLSGDPLLHIVHTKEGVKAACMALAYGTAKDRKKALKCMKGHVGAMARDEWCHLALITALSVVDDTTLLRKTVVSELQKDLAELAGHKYGYRVLCQLLHPDCGRYLPPQLLAIARPPTKEYSAEAMQRQLHTVVPEAQAQEQKQEAAAAAAADSDDEGGGGGGGGGGGSRPTSGPLGVSKKDPAVRRRELLGSGPGSLAGALGALCCEAAPALIRSQHGSEVLVEVCRGGEGGLLAACLEEGDPSALPAVHDALVAAAAGGSEGGEAEGGAPEGGDPVLSNFFGSRALRRLVLASGEGGGPAGAAAAAFTRKLWSGALQGRCAQWVDSHAAKVLAALLQCGDATVKEEAAAELRPLVKGSSSLEEWSARLTAKQPQQKPQQKKPQQQKPDKPPPPQQQRQPAAAPPAGRQRQPAAAAAAGGAPASVKKQPQRSGKKK